MKNVAIALAGAVLVALSGCATKPTPAHTHEYTMHVYEPPKANDCIHVVETVTFDEYGFGDGNHIVVPTTRRTMKAAPCGEGAIPLNPAITKGSFFEYGKVNLGQP